jgi:hypothetical protein
MLGARPKEHKRIAEDVADLIRDGFLVHEGQRLQIRNFVEAQDRTPGAKRTAAWRAQKNINGTSPTESQPAAHVTSHEPSHVTSHVHSTVTAIRSDPTRSDPTRSRERAETDSDPTTEPDPDQSSPQAAPTPAGEPKAHKPDRKRPATRQPADGIVADWLHGWGIPQTQDPTWGSEVQKFLDWHASKDSRFVDWSAAWRTWRAKAAEFGRGPSAPLPPRGSRPVQRSPEYQPTEERKRAEFIAENARKQRELGLVPDEHGQVF